jgi:elongation factor G
MILGAQDEGHFSAIEAQAPLAEMFGYSTVLRSLTQGQAQFTMEFLTYRQVPKAIAEELIKQAAEDKKNVA